MQAYCCCWAVAGGTYTGTCSIGTEPALHVSSHPLTRPVDVVQHHKRVPVSWLIGDGADERAGVHTWAQGPLRER